MARYILQSAHLISNFCVNLFCLKSENQGAEEAKITTKVVSRSPVPTSSYPPTKLKKITVLMSKLFPTIPCNIMKRRGLNLYKKVFLYSSKHCNGRLHIYNHIPVH
ncbi:uncharacterized protein LOC124337289 isoform X1 [Daphnia pulicaria]|uniref:uncharacterized protein LOC124337289 isoform X1 n=1 Tax=Daphnia pulicaria TaxID=35523 RepID=UPI001EEC143D|nr:uncharacterized protein LOC124337289 isoform X1 [Daphnia pulicaria]